MTKQRELEILDATIKQLGPDSYLGPWLRESRASIERDLQSDFVPMCQMPGAARAEAQDIITAARTTADGIREDAEKRAKELVDKARSDAADIRRYSREALVRLIDKI
jgi:cell division septum initiation protein DivIVA